MYVRVHLMIQTQSSMIYMRVSEDGSEDLCIINHKTNINTL